VPWSHFKLTSRALVWRQPRLGRGTLATDGSPCARQLHSQKKAESPVAESLTPVGGRPLHSPALDLQQPLSVNYRTALILQNRCAADAQAAQPPAGGGAQFGGGRETGGAGVEVALRRQAPRH